MPFFFKASYRWSEKVLRVSSPLKLRKTLYFQLGVEEENDDEEAIWTCQILNYNKDYFKKKEKSSLQLKIKVKLEV